jgi:hypothetical protein
MMATYAGLTRNYFISLVAPAGTVTTEAWDPSVKSLVPFPRILRMMDGELDWTEQRGGDQFLVISRLHL